MKVLHTADWHIGRSLYGRKRYEEFSKFLDWLAETIEAEKIDLLLVAGDIFDTSTPSNLAQKLYYRFLCKVSTSCCRHVVVIGGNHDSPSFLNAPKELLHAINVHVVGSMTENLEDEVIVLYHDKKPEAIVCAVPYLRDKDIRTVEPGETIDDKNIKLINGLKSHYAEVCEIAEEKRAEAVNEANGQIPIIAMGHLFTAGGKTLDGDGVRELYVGSLAHVGKDIFPTCIDYLALGHLHVPQKVAKADHLRYCGSPIPMGYGEANQKKVVLKVEFNGKSPEIKEIPVPRFQELVRLTGSLDEIHNQLLKLRDQESKAWLEIEYTGDDILTDLRDMLDEAIEGSAMEIRRILNKQVKNKVLKSISDGETLDDLDPAEVFTRCLDAYEIPKEDRDELIDTYAEVVKSILEEDVKAE